MMISLTNTLRSTSLFNFVSRLFYRLKYKEQNLVIEEPPSCHTNNTIRFSITPATGGMVVMVRAAGNNSNNIADRENVYVVHEEVEDIPKEISQIVFSEMLKQR